MILTKKMPVILLAAAAIVSASGCAELLKILQSSGFKNPTLAFQNASLTNINLDEATVDAAFNLTNPNAVGISVAGINFDFALDSQKLFDSSAKGGLTVPSQGTAPLTFPITVPFKAIPKLFETFANKNEAPYDVKGQVSITSPIGNIPIPLQFSGMLPIPKLPKISLNSASVTNVSMMGASMLVSLNVNNPNSFALPLNALLGNLTVSGNKIAQLGLDAPKPLDAGKQTTVNLPINLNFLSSGMALYSAITSKNASVALDGEATIADKKLPLNLTTTLTK